MSSVKDLFFWMRVYRLNALPKYSIPGFMLQLTGFVFNVPIGYGSPTKSIIDKLCNTHNLYCNSEIYDGHNL